jgi:hypothetical protein
MALVARDRTLDGIAADKRLQLNDVDEVIGLAAQLIRNHRQLAGNRRDHRDPDATTLHRFGQWPEIAVSVHPSTPTYN